MTVYATKYWAFGRAWPVVSFSQVGTTERLLRTWQPGDAMLIIGTKSAPTLPEDRGRILGWFDYRAERVVVREIIPRALHPLFGERWPFGLKTVRGWRCVDKPPADLILPRFHAPRYWRTLAVACEALSAAEERAVRALAYTPFDLTPSEAEAEAFAAQAWASGRFGKPRGL